MDPVTLEAIKTVGTGALGWVWQQTRANPKFNNGLGYAIFGVAAVAVWFWATPSWQVMDWRSAVLNAATFALAARGAAASLKDAGAAPPSA